MNHQIKWALGHGRSEKQSHLEKGTLFIFLPKWEVTFFFLFNIQAVGTFNILKRASSPVSQTACCPSPPLPSCGLILIFHVVWKGINMHFFQTINFIAAFLKNEGENRSLPQFTVASQLLKMQTFPAVHVYFTGASAFGAGTWLRGKASLEHAEGPKFNLWHLHLRVLAAGDVKDICLGSWQATVHLSWQYKPVVYSV